MSQASRNLRVSVVPTLALFALLLSGCVDGGVSAPEGEYALPGGFVIVPRVSVLGAEGSTAAAEALRAAFDRVDRFRMVVRRASNNEVVVDTVIAVTPGQEQYDLSADVTVLEAGEQFTVELTALEGETELFTSEPVTVQATPSGGTGASGSGATVDIGLAYSGPGVEAQRVVVEPTSLVLAPGGSGSLNATVFGSGNTVIADVPVAYTPQTSGVVQIDGAGEVSTVGEGVTRVVVSTPTGLEAEAWVYVVNGTVAYVAAGQVVERSAAPGGAAAVLGEGIMPAYGPGGGELYVVRSGSVRALGGEALVEGTFPSVSPDGLKLAVDRSGVVVFANVDGTNATEGPGGTTPVWASDGEHVVVGGGSIERVRADGTERETVVEGEARWPAVSGDGRVAYVVGDELKVGDASLLPEGLAARSRPAWSEGGSWVVVSAGADAGLWLVPGDGSAPAVSLETGEAMYPAWKPESGGVAPEAPTVTGLDPEQPTPGGEARVLGSGFDWIIPTNNRVFFPTRDGSVEAEVLEVGGSALRIRVPTRVGAGQIRVVTRAGEAGLAFEPMVGSLSVTASTPWDAGVSGVQVTVSQDGSEVATGETDEAGGLLLAGLLPGVYDVGIETPVGFTVTAGGITTVEVAPGEAVVVGLEVTPGVQQAFIDPSDPVLEVGQRLTVRVSARDIHGVEIPEFRTVSWRGGAKVAAGGGTVEGTLAGVAPSEAAGDAEFSVVLNGQVFGFGATVTSYIEGTVLQEGTGLSGVTVRLKKDGSAVASTTTGSGGAYRFSGLLGGTYTVILDAPEGAVALPETRQVVLGATTPFGMAPFEVAQLGTVRVTARTPWDAGFEGVDVRLSQGGVEVARGTTDAAGSYVSPNLDGGTYDVVLTAPAGFTLTAGVVSSVEVTPGSAAGIVLEVTPRVETFVTDPAEPVVEVGEVLEVTGTATDVRGGDILSFATSSWTGDGTLLSAAGTQLRGALTGVSPSAVEGDASFTVELDEQAFTRSATVTSYIGGVILREATTSASPSSASAVETTPAAGVEVVLTRDGTEVVRASTDGSGAYRFGGLLAGTYTVTVTAPEGLIVRTPSVTLELGGETPTGVADFVLAELAAVEVTARTPSDEPAEGVVIALTLDDATASASAEVTDTTDAQGTASLRGLEPGTYRVTLTPPLGYAVTGGAVETLTLTAGVTETLALEVTPRVARVTITPEDPRVALGTPLEVTATPLDIEGRVIPTIREIRWFATDRMAALGNTLTGTVAGAYPSDAEGDAEFSVSLDGQIFTFHATVTSSIEGTVTKDVAPTTAEPTSGVAGRGASSASSTASDSTSDASSAASLPDGVAYGAGFTVEVLRDGTLKGTATSDGRGRYQVVDLMAGTYQVTARATTDRSPVPDTQSVTLDQANPTGSADILMSRAPVDSVEAAPTSGMLDALQAGYTLTVTPKDSVGHVLGGRRATFSSADTLVATVDDGGVVTAQGNGTTTLVVTVEGVADTVSVTVDQRVVKLTITRSATDPSPEDDSVIVFEADTGSVTWDARDANDFPVTHKTPGFASSDVSVATVDAAGLVNVQLIGFADISATLDDGADTLSLDVRRELPGDLVITGPSDLANAQANRYGRVTGSLFVESTTLTDLAGLETLLEVNGSGFVRFNPALADISALRNVKDIGGDLILEDNDALVTPSGLPATALEHVGASFRVLGNAGITHAGMFANLQDVDGDLEVSGNDNLANLDGLAGLSWIGGSLMLFQNPNLNSLANLPALTRVDGALGIDGGGSVIGFPALLTVDGDLSVGGGGEGGDVILQELQLPALSCVGGASDIYTNQNLHTVGLPALTTVGEGCSMSIAPSPAALSAAAPLTSRTSAFNERLQQRAQARRLAREERGRRRAEEHRTRREEQQTRRDATRAERLAQEATSALGDIVSLGQEMNEARREHARLRAAQRRGEDEVERVRRPRKVHAAPEAASVYGGNDFSLSHNPALSSLDLGSLTSVDGSFHIEGNVTFATLDLPALQQTGRDFCLNNTVVVTLSAPALHNVGWDLCFWTNPDLTTMDLSGLVTVGGDLDVDDNDALLDLSLPSLDWVDDEVDIDYNDALRTVDMPVFTGQDYDGGDFEIHDNPALRAVTIATTTEVEFGWWVGIDNNDNLRTLSIPGFAYSGDDLEIYENPLLESITLATLGPADVDWDFEVYSNDALRFLDAPGVQSTSDDVWIDSNPALERIKMPGLQTIGDDLQVNYNGTAGTPLSTDFSGLVSTDDDLDVSYNDGIVNLDFTSLTDVGDDVWILDNITLNDLTFPVLGSTDDWFEVDGNPVLTGFTVPNLTSVGGSFEVDDLPMLTTFSAPNLGNVGWSVYIDTNDLLHSFDLGSLVTVGIGPSYGNIDIYANPSLSAFNLSSLRDVQDLAISDADAMPDLPDLGALGPTAGVFLNSNDALTAVGGLAGVTELRTIRLNANPALTDVTALGSLQAADNVQFWNNAALVSVNALGSLSLVRQNLEILNNDALTSTSFAALAMIGSGAGPSTGAGNLYLNGNPNMATASFPLLATLDASLQVTATGLTNLSGFSTLKSPVYDVLVNGNIALDDVSGLSGIGTTNAAPAVAGLFQITNNPNLSDCNVWALVDAIEAWNPGGAFANPPVVSGNQMCSQ